MLGEYALMRPFKIIMTSILCCLLIAACDDYPKDVKGSYNRIIQSGMLKTGVIHSPPQSDIEIKIIEEFARQLDVNTAFITLPESRAFALLEKHELDIVIGGLTENNPRRKSHGFTRPYFKNYVIALPQGENRLITILEKFLKKRDEI